jgi:DNA replication and repair protein RecF
MPLSTLQLTNFRSYPDREFNFDADKTVITGPNGSGKTNILEAIYLLGMSRSFRGSPARMARHGQPWFRVSAWTSDRNQLAVIWQQKQKQLLRQGEQVKPRDFIGYLPVVLFEPGGLGLIYGSPSYRRHLMDRILSFSDSQYLTSLLRFRRILKQRNSLLRRGEVSKDQVFGWDVLLVEQAAYIRRCREDLVAFFNQSVPAIYRDITGDQNQIEFTYASKTGNKDYPDELLRQLAASIQTDFTYAVTGYGPHRDDMAVTHNSRPLAEVGSRGEVRTATVALMLGELSYIRQHARSEPLLLLDDVFSELDERRQAALLEHIHETQTIITATHPPQQLETGCATIEL